MGLSIDTFKARMTIAKQNFGEIIDLALFNASKPVLATIKLRDSKDKTARNFVEVYE